MRTKRENLTPWAEEGIAWLQARTEEAAERQRQDDALHAEVAEHVASAGDRACGQCGYLKCSCFYAQKVSIRFDELTWPGLFSGFYDEAAKAIAEHLKYRDAQLLRSIGSGGLTARPCASAQRWTSSAIGSVTTCPSWACGRPGASLRTSDRMTMPDSIAETARTILDGGGIVGKGDLLDRVSQALGCDLNYEIRRAVSDVWCVHGPTAMAKDIMTGHVIADGPRTDGELIDLVRGLMGYAELTSREHDEIARVWREHEGRVKGAVEAHEDSRMVSKTGTVDVE